MRARGRRSGHAVFAGWALSFWTWAPSVGAQALAPPSQSTPAAAPSVAPESTAPAPPTAESEPSVAPAAVTEPISSGPSVAEPPKAPTAQPPAPAPAAVSGEAPDSAAPSAKAVPAPPAEQEPAVAEPVVESASELDVQAFADGYFGLNAGMPVPQADSNTFHGFDPSNGFALSWVGVDGTYAGPSAGVTIALRFGPTAEAYAGADETAAGLANIKQAYATWRPLGDDRLALDFGKFDTIFGAEVAESWKNYNYTRGFLNYLGQPFFHTGLRGTVRLTDDVGMALLLVNGWNNSIDNNFGKTLGLQLNASQPRSEGDGPLLSGSLGYLVGPNNVDYATRSCGEGRVFESERARCVAGTEGPAGFREARDFNHTQLTHFVDAVVAFTPTDSVGVLLNADYGMTKFSENPLAPKIVTQQSWWGVSLAARYAIDDAYAVAFRQEVYRDADRLTTTAVLSDGGVVSTDRLLSSTLTLEAAPGDHLVFRLDNRLDLANDAVFRSQSRSVEKSQFVSTLGIVAKTN